MKKRYLLLLVLVLLVSCSMPKDPASLPLGVEVPDQWTAKKAPEGVIDGRWWTAFKDESLNQLVEEALRNNQDIRQAAARINAAGALARMAGADLQPRLSAGVSGARGKAPFLGQAVTRTDLGVSLDLSWEIDLWGRLRAGRRAALRDVEVARSEHSAARLSIAAQTIKAAFAVAELRQHIQLAETTVKTYRNSLTVAQDRFNRGVGGPLDVRLARANLASAEALHDRRREQLERTVRQLEIILGRYPKGALTGKASLPELPAEVPAGLPSELLARRPDLVAARFRVFAANARVYEAEASLLPRLSLTASGGTASDALGNLLNGSSAIWQLAHNLFQPIFQGGRLRANVDLQKSRSHEAVAAYVSVALNAFREVESALGAEQFLDGRTEKLKEASKHATAARRLADDRYQAGLGGILDVLEAQRRELDAQSRLLVVQRERLDNRVNLHLALGGEYEHTSQTQGDQ